MLLMAKMGKGYKHINFETLASLWRVESVKVWETLTWNSWHHADIFQKFLTCSGPSIWLALTAVHSQWPGRCSDGSLKTTKPMWSCLRRLSRDSDVWAYLKDGIKWVRMLKTTPDTSQIGLKVLKHLITPRMARQLCKSLKVLDKKLPSSILRRGFAAPRSDVHRRSIGFNFSCLRIHFVFYFELFTLCFWGSPAHARPCSDHARSKFDLTCVYPRDLHWSICKGERRTAGCIGPLGHGSNFCLKVLKSKNILSQTDAAERFFFKDLTSILCVVVAQACVPSIQLEDDFVKYPDQASSFCIWRFSPESQRARQLIL